MGGSRWTVALFVNGVVRMVSTDKLIYLSLQKTACTYVNRLLTETFGAQLTPPKHGRIPAEFPCNGRAVVSTIRSPWEWYVSLWAFGCEKGNQGEAYRSTTNRQFRPLLGKGPATSVQRLVGTWKECRKSTEHWRRLYQDPRDAGAFREWLCRMFEPAHAYDVSLDYAASTTSGFAGLLTFRYASLFWSDTRPLFGRDGVRSVAELQDVDREHNVVDFMLRNETLAADLVSVLRAVGHVIDDSLLKTLQRERRTNSSTHYPAAYYYDAATRDLVAQREAFIIAKYGYQPPRELTESERRDLGSQAAPLPFASMAHDTRDSPTLVR
jgi:hypothetical protein